MAWTATDMTGGKWTSRSYHRAWLLDQANGLFEVFQYRFVNPRGGFFDLDRAGRPRNADGQIGQIHTAARAVHCFAVGALLGRPGAADIVDHGMQFLWSRHRDQANGGYYWSVDAAGPADANKQGYGHAFVLLAAASAKTVDHPLADSMLADITEILNSRFWEPKHGAIAEEFSADWTALDGGQYRGQNSNMHLTEALMAAFEATGDRDYLAKAESIADLIIRRKAGSVGWRVAEHFGADWETNRSYTHPDEMFRPSGTTPGHWLEWARLVLQLWALGGKTQDWMPAAARHLFAAAMNLGWDHDTGGFFYTLDWNDVPSNRIKLWWPMAEGAAAAHFLNEHMPGAFHEDSYRRIWNVIDRAFVDRENGGWHEELTEDLRPSHALFPGKGDIYHALQACLIPLFPAEGSLAKMVKDVGLTP